MKASSFWGAANVVLSTSAASHSLAATQLRATLPQPTPPPGPDDSHLDLVKRTAALEMPLTMMIAPDNTCGWMSARFEAPYSCNPGETCGLVLAQTTLSGAIMCFNEAIQTYNLFRTCINYSAYFSSDACDSSCVRNTFIGRCTERSSPYCVAYAFPGNITAYKCHSLAFNGPAQTILTSWRHDGETGHKNYSKLVKFVLPFSGYMDFTSISDSAMVESLTTTSAATGADFGSSGGDNPAKESSKTPVGAIVGGVVGGVAAIGAGLLTIFFCLRRRKSRTAGTTETPPSTNQPSMQPMASPGISMTQKQVPAFYDSHSNHGSEPLQTYPASAQQYSRMTPSPQGGYFSQPSLDSSSPTVSKIAEFRISQMAASPTPTSTDAYGAPAPGQQLYAQQTQSGDSQAVQDQQQQKQRIQGNQPQIHQPPLETPVHEVAA
ncbi:hypothetical protein E4U57_002877 [Claviceps arundinis]|uniref:Uncharacterized protein n=1 Tax=Claviceps arundinis TaxID=1623583 RepID=A0ABQ7PKA3_9HYPO|nr:hypothetical protein E4U57_002877 [Claviceps arundinis]